jgi:hypothetical protein
MERFFRKSIPTSILVGSLLACASPVFASTPNITITINSDFSANGAWEVPVVSGSDTKYYVPEYPAYDSALSTRYKLDSVLDDAKKPVTFAQVDDGIIGVDKHITATSFNVKNYLNYTLTPYFRDPVAVYEFWTGKGSELTTPVMHITFPDSWKVLSVSPTSAKVSGNSIDYELISAEEARPVTVIFQTNPVGTVQQTGKYKVSGTYSDVQLITSALAKIPNVDDVMMKNIGIKPPDTVYIVADNLTKVGEVGQEAEALAGYPNIIIFNNQLDKNKSPEEVAEILSHELLHLAMHSKILFDGKSYADGQFMDEGIAVYFQGLMHKLIFADTNKRLLNEELHRTHTVSPSEANALYDSKFELTFDGFSPQGVAGDYARAGLLFARFADVSGAQGFNKFFDALRYAKPFTYGQGDDGDTIFNALKAVSGLSVAQLEFPGKSEGDVTGVVSRISHPDNDEDASARVETNYIQNNVKHYFSGMPLVRALSTAVQTPPPPANTSSTKITLNLGIASTGDQVITLQTFLEAKGFLKLPVGTSKGYFGQVTRSAVIAFQRSQELSPVGSVGPKTRAVINAAL